MTNVTRNWFLLRDDAGMTSHEEHPEAMTSHDDQQDATEEAEWETAKNPTARETEQPHDSYSDEELPFSVDDHNATQVKLRYRAELPHDYPGESEPRPFSRGNFSSYAGEYLNIRGGTWGDDNHQPDSREYDEGSEIDLDYFVWKALN